MVSEEVKCRARRRQSTGGSIRARQNTRWYKQNSPTAQECAVKVKPRRLAGFYDRPQTTPEGTEGEEHEQVCEQVCEALGEPQHDLAVALWREFKRLSVATFNPDKTS